jgi:hypothetical protein
VVCGLGRTGFSLNAPWLELRIDHPGWDFAVIVEPVSSSPSSFPCNAAMAALVLPLIKFTFTFPRQLRV